MSTGSELRDQREAAGISKDQLASMISVRAGLISQMELNDFSRCGGDTYSRGHLKNIALRLGLEPDYFVEMYNAEHSIEHRGIHDQLLDNNVGTIPREARKISWKIPALISVFILVVAGSIQIVLSNQSSTTTPEVAAKPSPVASVTPDLSHWYWQPHEVIHLSMWLSTARALLKVQYFKVKPRVITDRPRSVSISVIQRV